jgi:DNA polymerase III subunit delta
MKNIYLFHGEDSYSSFQKAIHWQKEFEKKYGDLNSHSFEGNQFTYSHFNEAISTMPFLSEKKLIIIKNLFADTPTEEARKIAEKISEVDDFCVIVFVERKKADSRTTLFKSIKKNGQIIEFPAPDRNTLISWIIQEFKTQNIAIKSSSAAALADTVGPDLWQMQSEIEKLTLYAGEQEITPELIEKIATPSAQISIFKLTEYISQKRAKESLATLNRLIAGGENLIPLMFLIAGQIRNMIQIKDCLQKNMAQPAIIKKTKIHPFAVSNQIKQCHNFSQEQLINMHTHILQLDNDIKNGKIKMTTDDQSELRLSFEKFILQHAGLTNKRC